MAAREGKIYFTGTGIELLKRAVVSKGRNLNEDGSLPDFSPHVDVNSQFIAMDFGGDVVVYLNVRHIEYFCL